MHPVPPSGNRERLELVLRKDMVRRRVIEPRQNLIEAL
jgi:hypothetical protein